VLHYAKRVTSVVSCEGRKIQPDLLGKEKTFNDGEAQPKKRLVVKRSGEWGRKGLFTPH